jgi:hypothetical protein
MGEIIKEVTTGGGEMSEENQKHATSGTDEIVCPHCGCKHENSNEFFWSCSRHETEGECDDCGKSFKATREFEIRYWTEKVNTNEEG